jgi:glycerol kinase
VVKALAIDVGSSSIRTALVDERGVVSYVHQRPLHVATPSPGYVELDAAEIVNSALELAALTLGDGGACACVGVTNQRATTIVFDPATGVAVGPALSWQDLRTVIDCLVLQGEGLRLAPNQSATKVRWLVEQAQRPSRELRFATIETWLVWHLSQGASFVSDRSNAGVTGLVNTTLDGWDERTLSLLALDPMMLPEIVDTICHVGPATALPGAPPITAIVGDQSASLFGQSCVRTGAKVTFGTGAMLDLVHGDHSPPTLARYPSGCYPVALRSRDGVVTWGVEGIVFSAGSCVEWLVDLGLIGEVAESESLATSVPDTAGVAFVPAFSGLGTPEWDFGARGGFFGLTRGSSRAHLVRAVLEGVAHRGADLLDAAQREVGATLHELHVDGGMSANRFFVQRLADFSGHVVSVSSEREATTRGAGLMALVGAGHLTLEEVETLWSPAFVATPALSDQHRLLAREAWAASLAKARRTIPELSDVSF